MFKFIQILAVRSVSVAGLSLAFPLAASAGWFGFGDPSCTGNASDVEKILSHDSGSEVHLKTIRTLGKNGNILRCAAEAETCYVAINSCNDYQKYYFLSLTDEGKLWIEWYRTD
jgi:hypothetical protein